MAPVQRHTDGRQAPACDLEHVEIARRGKQAIDAWNDAHRGEALRLCGADLRGADLGQANLQGADLRGADLSNANLQGADLREANLTRARLFKARLDEAVLTFARLRKAELIGASLRGAVLLSARLDGAELQRANLSAADLGEAGLQSADLAQASLREAELCFARLSRANLRGADLLGANLLGANLARADLEGARLKNANLVRADLSDAQLRHVGRLGWRRSLLFWRFPFKLDDTRTLRTRFESSSADPWSMLRRRSTWPLFALWMAVLFVFLTPQLLLAAQDPRRMAELFGWQQDPRFFLLLLAPAAVYTALRGWLTYRVTLLDAHEQRTGYAPAWREYGACVWLGVVSRLLFLFLCCSWLAHQW